MVYTILGTLLNFKIMLLSTTFSRKYKNTASFALLKPGRLQLGAGVGAVGGLGWGIGGELVNQATMTPEERKKYTRKDALNNIATNTAGGLVSGGLLGALKMNG